MRVTKIQTEYLKLVTEAAEEPKENDLLKKLETMDTVPLEKEIERILGSGNLGIEIELEKSSDSNRREAKLRISSYELKDETGIMNSVFSSVKVSDFNSGVYKDTHGNEGIWASIVLRYELPDGGRNAVDLMTASWDANNKVWSVKTKQIGQKAYTLK